MMLTRVPMTITEQLALMYRGPLRVPSTLVLVNENGIFCDSETASHVATELTKVVDWNSVFFGRRDDSSFLADDSSFLADDSSFLADDSSFLADDDEWVHV
jgi:hypothetical protein